MSQYTTGEIAKLAGVTVRTVQYYDSRGILIPSDFSEGGRRLYNEDDLKRLRIICFLRDLGIQINDISEILSAENSQAVISLLLEQQLKTVQAELAEREKQRATIEALQKELKYYEHFSVEHLTDIAYQMKNRKKLKRTHMTVLTLGIIAEIIEVCTFVLGIQKGIWLPYLLGLLVVIAITAYAVRFYYRSVAYICPECHKVFRPNFGEFFFANHTMATRKLKCTECGHRGFCVESYQPVNSVKN